MFVDLQNKYDWVLDSVAPWSSQHFTRFDDDGHLVVNRIASVRGDIPQGRILSKGSSRVELSLALLARIVAADGQIDPRDLEEVVAARVIQRAFAERIVFGDAVFGRAYECLLQGVGAACVGVRYDETFFVEAGLRADSENLAMPPSRRWMRIWRFHSGCGIAMFEESYRNL